MLAVESMIDTNLDDVDSHRGKVSRVHKRFRIFGKKWEDTEGISI
jgi:hypothetical protein